LPNLSNFHSIFSLLNFLRLVVTIVYGKLILVFTRPSSLNINTKLEFYISTPESSEHMIVLRDLNIFLVISVIFFQSM